MILIAFIVGIPVGAILLLAYAVCRDSAQREAYQGAALRMAHCDHTWRWEASRMLCSRCDAERPTDETLEYTQVRIAELEAEVARLTKRIEYMTVDCDEYTYIEGRCYRDGQLCPREPLCHDEERTP